MTFTVYKTQADAVSVDFDGAVEAYRQALLKHRFCKPARLAIPGQPAIPAVRPILPIPAKGYVPAKPGRPGSPGRSAIMPVPAVIGSAAPTAHALIEACVRRVSSDTGPDDYVSDYVIVDDTV